MAEVCLNGLGVALITPFKEDYSIDFEALRSLVDYVIEGGVDYIVALGTTAETPTLTLEEKQKIAKIIKEQTKQRVPLVLGIGGNNTQGVINDILSRDLSGYSAILSVAPYYNKPPQKGLFLHFESIAKASPLPILLYNVPGRTGVNLTSITSVKLSNLNNICGIKEASGDLLQCEEIIKNSSDNFHLISGNDSDTYSIMKLGGKGVISVLANALPSVLKELVSLCASKKYEEAKLLQEELTPLVKHLFVDGNPAGVKSLLSKIGLSKNILRLPLVPVSEKVQADIEATSQKWLGI